MIYDWEGTRTRDAERVKRVVALVFTSWTLLAVVMFIYCH